MRRLLVPLLLAGLGPLSLPATPAYAAEPEAAAAPAALPSDAQLLAAARKASTSYREHVAAVREQLASPDVEQRLAALRTLGRMQDSTQALAILDFVASKNRSPVELATAADALAGCGDVVALAELRKLSVNSDAEVRFAAYNALGLLAAATPADHSQRALDSNEDPHLAALTNLGTIKQADAAPLLVAGLAHHPRALVRQMCAIGLGRIGDVTNAPALIEALSDGNPEVRAAAANALTRMGHRPAVPFMLMALEANIAGTPIYRALRLLTGQDFGFDTRADVLHRQAAIDRGFAWWTANAGKS